MHWVLRKLVRFEAAHHLPHHDGKCARVHGHSWRVAIEVRGRSLHKTGPKTGMLIDYADLSDAMAPILAKCLDHHDLNQTTGLHDPTSEALARWLYDRLSEALPGLVAVTVYETCTSECRYARD